MDGLYQLDPMTLLILCVSILIMVLVLFAKFIHILLKLAIIAVMALVILYFLREAGII